MTQGRNDTMAQAVFLAQLEAAKGKCNCATCRILRRASEMMTSQFLKPSPAEGQETLSGILSEDRAQIIAQDEGG